MRGRDIQRYKHNWDKTKLWLIATFPSLKINIDFYPAIKKYLLSFTKERLEQASKTLPDGTKSRKKTTHAWYELQDTCAYHAEFEKQKIIWGNLSIEPRFALTSNRVFISAPSNILTGGSIKYLVAWLNSRLCHYKMRQIAYSREQGYMEYKKVFVEQLPVPQIVKANRHIVTQLENLVDEILTITENKDYSQNITRQTRIKEYEMEVDRLVYELYGLTKNEIKIVEYML